MLQNREIRVCSRDYISHVECGFMFTLQHVTTKPQKRMRDPIFTSGVAGIETRQTLLRSLETFVHFDSGDNIMCTKQWW